MAQRMNFGTISLFVLPKRSNLEFENRQPLSDVEKCILDKLWSANTPQKKIDSLNALVFYFNQ